MIYSPIKRLFDLLASTVLILLLLPFFLPLLLALRLTAEGEVFYFQKRIGLHNQYFYIWKLATMLKDSPNMGTGEITLRNDPRVTPLGRYLRITKLNELPQLVNVWKGDMSFVGPRPLVDRTFQAYPAEVREVIYRVKPGITGIGSIVFRDEEKLLSESGMDPQQFYDTHIGPYKGALEMWYQQRQSFRTDLQILLLTAWSLVAPASGLVYRVFPSLPRQFSLTAKDAKVR